MEWRKVFQVMLSTRVDQLTKQFNRHVPIKKLETPWTELPLQTLQRHLLYWMSRLCFLFFPYNGFICLKETFDTPSRIFHFPGNRKQRHVSFPFCHIHQNAKEERCITIITNFTVRYKKLAVKSLNLACTVWTTNIGSSVATLKQEKLNIVFWGVILHN